MGPLTLWRLVVESNWTRTSSHPSICCWAWGHSCPRPINAHIWHEDASAKTKMPSCICHAALWSGSERVWCTLTSVQLSADSGSSPEAPDRPVHAFVLLVSSELNSFSLWKWDAFLSGKTRLFVVVTFFSRCCYFWISPIWFLNIFESCKSVRTYSGLISELCCVCLGNGSGASHDQRASKTETGNERKRASQTPGRRNHQRS